MRFEAEFVCSAMAIAQCPRWDRVEIAIAGRSNVGKSSFLNALAGRTNLARTSKTPGRTRGLNFFTVAEQLALVDLPGYGYAKMAHQESGKISRLLDQYLSQRHELKGLVLLVDARRGPGSEEFTIAQRLQNPAFRFGDCPQIIVVATKCDKLNKAEVGPALRRLEAICAAPSMCSSRTGEGIPKLRREILRLASAHTANASASGLGETPTS